MTLSCLEQIHSFQTIESPSELETIPAPINHTPIIMFPDDRVPKKIGDCIQTHPATTPRKITLLADNCRCPRRLLDVLVTSDLPVAIDRTLVKSIDRFKVREILWHHCIGKIWIVFPSASSFSTYFFLLPIFAPNIVTT